jgi:pimeloyl-[acyl-carrier protein] methyl ester esterase
VLDPLDLLIESDRSHRSDEVPEKVQSLLSPDGATYLAGWSLGGMLALRIAESSGSRLSGLCLVSTTLEFCPDNTQHWGADPHRVMAMQEGLSRHPESTLKAFHRLAARPGRPLDAIDHHQIACMVKEKLDALGTGLDYLLQTDLRSCDFTRLPETVIVHGNKDSIIPVQAGRELGATIQNARFNEIPNVGHDLPIRHPAIMVETLDGLINADRIRHTGNALPGKGI